MRTNYFFIIALFCCLSASAQVPGYMGRRFSVGYSNDFFPRLPFMQLTANEMSKDHIFNASHCLEIDYVKSHKLSLCGGFQYSKMDFVKAGVDNQIDADYDEGGAVYYLPADGKPMKIISRNLAIGLKFFKHNYIAPYGKYNKLELVFCFNKILMDQDALYTQDRYSSSKGIIYKKQTFTGDIDKFKNLVVAFTVGKQRMISHRMILDWGVRMGVSTNAVFRSLDLFEDLSLISGVSPGSSFENGLKTDAHLRVFSSQLFRVHLGLKFLAF